MAQVSPVRTWPHRVGRIRKPGAAWIRSRGAHLYPAWRTQPPSNLPISATCSAACSYCPSVSYCQRCARRRYSRSRSSAASAVRRLALHESRAQVTPVAVGIPWLGFVVFADHRLVKARKVRFSARRLRKRYADYRAGALSFAEFDASVGGWINHVRYVDTWGLRQHVLQPFALNVGDVPHRTTRLVRRSQMSLMTRPSAPHATAPARRSARTEVQTRSRPSSACHRAGIAANILVTRDVESTLMAEPKLDLLMQMVQRVLDGQKDIREDLREIKARLGRLETDVAQLHVYLAEQSTRLDRFSDRLERVERRLEIVET